MELEDTHSPALQKTIDDSEINELQLNQMNIEDGSDNRNLLPSDDQLDRFVENLCENATFLSKTSPENSADAESKKHSSKYFSPQYTSTTVVRKTHIDNVITTVENVTVSGIINGIDEISGISMQMGMNAAKNDRANVCTKQDEIFENGQPAKVLHEKRSLPKGNLNVAIIQCSRSLENLITERKVLEALIQKRHQIQNINHNVVYTPRLPEAPTRVDRLLYDANAERCRILCLMTTLESTIDSFSSTNTKEQLRDLLLMYKEAIVDVLKERQCEINVTRTATTYDAGVVKLVELIDRVHYMNRHIRTALWCLSFKEQTELAKARKRMQLAATTASVGTTSSTLSATAARQPMLATSTTMQTVPFKCEIEKLMMQKWQGLQKVHAKQPISPRPFRNMSHKGGRFRQNQGGGNGMTLQNQHQKLSHLFSPPTSRQKKSTRLMQLYAQEERAEIFERFSSARL